MRQFAADIRKDIDLLVDRYDAGLRSRPGYDRLPEASRRDLERHVLSLIAQCVETADYTPLVQYVQQRVAQWETLGFPLTWFQQALLVPEGILTPLIHSVEASNFLWQALNRSQDVVWQMVAERAHQTEERFRSIVETSHSGVLIIDDAFHLTYVNDELVQICGYTREELLGVDFRRLLDEESQRIVADHYIRRQRGGDVPPRYEVAFLRKDGAKRYIEMSAVSLTDLNGKPYTVAQVLDVSERKRAELTLAQERNLLRILIDALPDQVFVKDTQGRIILYNQADARAMRVASTEEALGKSVYDLYPRELADEYHADDMAVIQSDQPLYDREEPGLNEDGSPRWVLTTKVPLKDQAGNRLGLVGIARDITQRKQIESTLQESEERFRRFSEATTEGLVFHDKGVILDANPAIVTLFGFTTAAGLIGRNLLEFLVPDSRPVVLQKMQQDDVHPYEVQCIRNDGTTFPAETSTRTYQYGDRTIRASAVRDITERKRLELQIHESLARRSIQVQTSTEVAQDIAAAPELGELFHRVVTLIKDRFHYYHAQLFRYEPSQNAVVLITGYGETGQKMLATGHKLQLGQGVVGTAAATGHSILAADVRQSGDWRPNPNLPNTQGELAVPIKLRDQVLGILDVQSDQVNKLTDDDRLLLEGLCGQIAIAIESKRLIDSAQQSERLMRTLIDAMPDHIYAKDRDGRLVLANLAQARLHGVETPDVLIGKSDFDFYPRELAEQYLASEQPILRDGRPLLNHEEPNLDAAGRSFWSSTTKVPLRDSQGEIIGLVGMTADITARKKAETERERLLQEQRRRAVQLQTASEVSRAASSILNLDELLPQTVERIRTRFELYYVGIFLLDETEQWAILRAGTGEAGHIMLANDHRLEIGGNSMISQCIVTQRARIALDVGEEAVRFENPLLPLTRSEMALPLVSRGRTIGAMTIQSDQPEAFTAEDVTALQSMADQIGNAVENARLYAQTQTALGDTDRLLQASAELNVSQSYNEVLDVVRKYTVLGQQALTVAINVFDRPWTESQTPVWIEVIAYHTRRSSGIDVGTRFPIGMFPSAKSLLRSDAPAIIENFDTAQVDPNTYGLFVQRFASKSVIFMPLVVGGQWFGYLNVLYSNPTQFDEADVRRLMAMVGQAAVAVQNLRNLAAAQQTLTETEASYRATQAIGRAQTVEGILEATTNVVDLIGLTRATLRVVSRRDVTNTVMATDIYAYHRLDEQWVLQPVAKDVPASDSTTLKSLQRNPDAVVIYADAQNPNSAMPDEVREILLADQLRGSIITSVSLQNEVLGFLSFSGPQALNEAAEQRLRLAIRTLSDQVAVALQNRLLFEQTRAALQEVDAINRRLTGEAWDTYLHQQAGRDVIWLADDDAAAPEVLSQLDEQLTAGEITIEPDPEDGSEATVTAPILLRGQPIGALRLRTPLSEWGEDTEAMLADIAGHIAQAVENARLVEQTQRTAQRERMINEINARVRQSVDLDAILRTAVNELGQSLKAARVMARVGTTATEGSTAAGDGRGKTND